MKLEEIITVCLVLCAVDSTRANDDKLEKEHNLIKRQAQDIHSPPSSRRHLVSPDGGEPYFKYQPPVSSGRESFPGRQAASVGEVGRETFPGRQAASVGGVPAWKEATTRVRVAGTAARRPTASAGTNSAQRNGASKPLVGGSRGRTYKYPFGKERVQYTGLQPQGYINDTRVGGDNGGYGSALSQQDTLIKQQQQHQEQQQRQQQQQEQQHQEQQQQEQQQQEQQQRQQRYNSVYGRPAQRSASNFQNDTSSAAANQDARAADLQEQEIRRRHEELRRRHEEERRRQEEDRRRLIEERRKNDEERRRLYYEQQQQRANQQRGYSQGDTGSQRSGLHGNRQGAAIPTVNTEQRAVNSDQSSGQQAQRTDSNIQQGYEASSNQETTSNISPHRGRVPPYQLAQDDSRQGRPQPQQPVYSSTQQLENLPQHQKTTYSGSQQSRDLPQHQQPPHSRSQQAASQPHQQPNSGNQQGGYLPPHQQSTYSVSQQTGSQPQQPSINGSPQRGYLPQQPTYSGYQAQHQQPVYNPAQTHSPDRQQIFRLNNTQSAHPQDTHQQQGFFQTPHQQPDQVDPWLQHRSNFSSSRSNRDYPGQGQRYPYPGRGANLGPSFSYEQQDTDLDCPETGIDLRINGLDCLQAVQQFGTYLCYTHEFTSRDCCQVCRPRKQIARTGCEYGDHAELCSSITPADCYDLRNRYSCCETCERLKRHHLPAGCEYGDMTVRCDNVRQTPGLCYVPDNQRLCCETCNQIRNLTNMGCPWGDYHSNLCQLFEENTSNIRINCYSKQRQKLCCQSCERLRGWISADLPAGCQYGDRPVIFTTSEFGRLNCSTLFSHFSTDECRTNDAVATNCCHTCHRLLNHRG